MAAGIVCAGETRKKAVPTGEIPPALGGVRRRSCTPQDFNLIDECANIGQIPNLEKLMATIRSREISACLVLQAQSQLKALYKDNADTIIGNCDSSIFLGGKEPTTLKELATIDELAVLDGGKCIIGFLEAILMFFASLERVTELKKESQKKSIDK